MFAAVACLLDIRTKVSPTSTATRAKSVGVSGRPRCPRPKTAYTLRKVGHYDYTVMDGKIAVGHAFGLEAFVEGTLLWTVRAYDVDREVYSLHDAKDWLAGGNPPVPEEAV